MSETKADLPLHRTTDGTEGHVRRLRVDVESVAKPERGEEPNTFKCLATIRVVEGEERHECPARLTVHHPRGWMGVEAGFHFEVDDREFPTFEARAEHACLQVVKEFPSNEIISVFLLGTGEPEFDSP